MNKKYLLELVQARIKQLQDEYRSYFDLENGPCKSYSGAACMRSRCKKDLGTLQLLEYLLMYCPDNMEIESQDICDAFDRLVEPRRLK